MPPEEINPAGLENEAAEKRAQKRREKQQAEAEAKATKEAEAKVDATIAEEKEKARKAALLPKIEERRNEARKVAIKFREAIEERRKEIARDEATLGDLEGSIITAGDVARHDPDRALRTIDRALERFATAS